MLKNVAKETLRLLLIEQDSGFARYVCEMLGQTRDLPACVDTVPDLNSGLGALLQGSYQAVVLSIAVADGAGLANLSLVQALAPEVPVILTGESDDEALALAAVHAGAQDYLVKSQMNPGWLERSLRYAMERHGMDRALLAAEEKYHSLFDHLVEGIFQTTPDGHFIMANAALARIYGYPSPEELMASLTDISSQIYVDPNRRAQFVRFMQEQGILTGFESEVYRKDGSRIWISECCRAVRNAQGDLLYYEGTVEDTTSRKAAEQKVRDSEVLYHSLVENLPQNIFRKDLQERFTFANQHFCRTLGRPLEEIVGKTDFDFFPPEMAEKYQRDDRRVIETGKAYETVEEHQPPGHKKMYVQVVKTPLHDAEGKIIGLQGIFWDISQQRRAEEKIRRANAALASSRKELHEKNLQMQEDLTMAREIQMTILPQQYPAFPRPSDGQSAFKFTHRYLPTGSVGGDFFTVSALSETEVAVFLCDVAGHGVRSALVTAMVRALVEELKPVAHNPGEFLTKLNFDLFSILKHTGTPLLTTAFYLVADWRSGKMAYANAGHPKPLLARRGARTAGLLSNFGGKSQSALGLLASVQYTASEVQLSPGDLVLLFTDGLVEVQNSTDELYTSARLAMAVRNRLALPTAELFDALLEEVIAFSGETGFTDDVAIVGMDLIGD